MNKLKIVVINDLFIINKFHIEPFLEKPYNKLKYFVIYIVCDFF